MSSARKYHTIEGTFRMLRGSLQSPTIAYETSGTLNAARDNGVFIFTGLSPSAHVCATEQDPSPGWWEAMVGSDKPIDTNRYFVVCANSIGSCFGSTGPAAVDPGNGELYRLSFPVLTLEDIATASRHVLAALGIKQLAATVGASMGGMSALAYSVMFPGISRGLVLISSAASSLPLAISLRSLQREIIRKDPAWRNGEYPMGEGPITGMRLARKLGMITYRSATEWEQRFGRERVTDERESGDPFCIDFEIESYLEAHANKFIGTFDANCYLYLSRAMDLFDISDHGGTPAAAYRRVRAERGLVVGVETDFLFPLHQQEELAEGLSQSIAHLDFKALPSIQGHDSFLVDMDRFRPVISDF
ncbi:MAG: homoserine O-acetyltransferase, partial [Pseudomonadales bacterium]